MILQSSLPRTMGEVGDGWRQNLPINNFIDIDLAIDKQGALPEPYRPQGWVVEPLPKNALKATRWFFEHEELLNIVRVADEDFRNETDTFPELSTKHSVTVRTGFTNATTVRDSFLIRHGHPRIKLHRQIAHADLPSGDSIPTPNRPKLAYTVNYGGSTEWFAGNFYLPRPRGNTGIHYAAIHLSMLLFLSPQIFRQEPHKFADDELVAFSKFAVHRMPAIDLSMSDRIFMRDSVSRFRKADKK